MEGMRFSFESLDVYQKARVLVKEIFGLGDQIRRAAVSITANLAEGSGRQSIRDKVHFVEIAYGSMTEVFCELQTACDLEYIKEEQLDAIRPQFIDISKMLSGLRNSLNKKLEK